MRTLKFRLRSKEDGKLIGSRSEGLTLYPESFQIYSGGLNVTNRFIIEQFTGLKDNKGKEIYEGDVIQIPDDYDTYGFNAGEMYEVFFNAGGFRLRPKFDTTKKGFWLEDDNTVEIFGNINEQW